MSLPVKDKGNVTMETVNNNLKYLSTICDSQVTSTSYYSGITGSYQNTAAGASASYQGASASYQGASASYQGSSASYQGSSASYQGSSASYQGSSASYQGSSASYQGSAGGASANYQGNKPSKNEIISKSTISRLLADVKNIMKNPLTENGIYYIHDEEDMLRGYALIIGPSETPYFGGNFFFEFSFPTDYPHSPPKITYCTNSESIRFNPNLYTNGKVCISILNTWRGEQWTSCQTISTVLLTLCTLLCSNPLLNEPGVSEKHQDFTNYNKIIEYKNIDIAVLAILEKCPGIYPHNFHSFYPYVRENFNKNKDKIASFLEKHANDKPELLGTGLYNMSVSIDYNKLHKKYLAIVEQLT